MNRGYSRQEGVFVAMKKILPPVMSVTRMVLTKAATTQAQKPGGRQRETLPFLQRLHFFYVLLFVPATSRMWDLS